MKGASTDLRICSLDQDPTPSLDTMRDFVHCFRVIHNMCACDLSAGCVAAGVVLPGNQPGSFAHVARDSFSNRKNSLNFKGVPQLWAGLTVPPPQVFSVGPPLIFSAVSDHSALRWLHSVEPKGRQARWEMDLQEYSFDIKHRPGSGNADALSCRPSSEARVQVPTCFTSFSPG